MVRYLLDTNICISFAYPISRWRIGYSGHNRSAYLGKAFYLTIIYLCVT
jgi:hypothetical protein